MNKYWAFLSLIPGVGPVRVKRLLERFGTPERIYRLREEELLAVPSFGAGLVQGFIHARNEIDLERFLRQCKEAEICLACPEDSEFPANLLHIYDPPPIIYYRGRLKNEDMYSIAIVGSRRMTAYGQRVTRKLVADLVRNRLTIVSGMALGVDGVAHRAALEAGGRTIAVLGSGVDVIYPREHRGLSEAIQRSGAVVSTFPPGTQPEKGNFPARNRIISGWAYGTAVIEAGERSGALITADLALEQGREVFAVPGSVFSPMSAGTHALIQKGAKLVTSAADILPELAPMMGGSRAAGGPVQPGPGSIVEKSHFTESQVKVLSLLETGEMGLEELLHEVGVGVSEMNTLLCELELAGVVRPRPGLKFARI